VTDGVLGSRGCTKLFRDLLEIEAGDWQYLAAQLRRGVRDAPAIRTGVSDEHGVRFNVVSAVLGRNGVVKPVPSAWIVKPDEPPILTTAFLAPAGVSVDTDVAPVPILPIARQRDWELLWQVAAAAASEAAQIVVPEPMRVFGTWYKTGAEGFATVRVFDARRDFAKWLRSAGHGRAGHKSGTWVTAPVRGYDAASAWAHTFAEVLGWHGIKCEVDAWED
jgi:hypothetical protein